MLARRVHLLNCQQFFILKSCFSVEPVSAEKKELYYKKLAAIDDSNTPDWDKAKRFESIPGPKPLPVIGNVWRFFPGGEFHNVERHKMMKSLHDNYGKVVKLSGVLGKRPMVFLFDPTDMENILRNAGTFPLRYIMDIIKYYRINIRKDIFSGLDGLVTAQGEEWYKFRTKVNPILMQPRTMRQYTSKMDIIAKDLTKLVRNNLKNESSQTIDNFEKTIYKWALESVSIIALNRRLGTLDINASENSDAAKFVKAVLTFFDHLYYLEVLPSFWKYLPSKRFNDFVKNLDFLTGILSKYIDEGLKDKIDDNVPEREMSVLRRLAKEDKNIAFVMTIDMISAGIDTTGKTLGAILYFLAKNPDKQDLLRAELKKYLPKKDSSVSEESLSEMVYLRAVIKEGMRISPIGLGNLRTTAKNMVIGGYQIPKHVDVVSVHFYSSCMTDEYFKQPEKFIPERWIRTNTGELSVKNVHPFVSLPFGFGPRSCVGQRLAQLELEAGIANIVRNFKLSWNQPDMNFGTKLLYGFTDPLKLTFKEVDQ